VSADPGPRRRSRFVPYAPLSPTKDGQRTRSLSESIIAERSLHAGKGFNELTVELGEAYERHHSVTNVSLRKIGDV